MGDQDLGGDIMRTPPIDQHLAWPNEEVVDHDPAGAAVNLETGGKVGLQGADDSCSGGRAILVCWVAEHGCGVTVHAGHRMAAKTQQVRRLAEKEIHRMQWIDAGVEDGTAGKCRIEQPMGWRTPKGKAEVCRD